MRVTSFVRRLRLVAVVSVALLAEITLSGCYVHNRPLRTELRPGVRLPPRMAILMYVDGVGNEMFDECLAAGDLPHIKKYILDRGLRYRRTVTCLPSITYAATATMLTGQSPGRHGIVGNKWFDPYSMQYQAYGYIRTYRTAQLDLHGPTIFELLHKEFTVSVQVATRRGVTREIDNWATSGISWYFGRYTDVDRLVAMRFELIAKMADLTGRWPTFIFCYFPAADETAHRFGIASPRYREAIRGVDEQIGRICLGLQRAGVLDRTLLALTTDHGQAPMRNGGGVVRADRYLRKRYGMRVTGKDCMDPDYIRRYEFFDRYDVVVVPDAPRLLGLHLRGQGLHWDDRPDDIRPMQLRTRDGRITAEQLAEDLADKPYARFVALRAGKHTVELLSRDGRALVYRKIGQSATRPANPAHPPLPRESFTYRIVQGNDPLHLGLPALKDAAAAPVTLTDAQWLAATIDSENPGVVSQITTYFGSPRAGDIVVFAQPGYGFAPNCSGHGSTTPQEMRIPLALAGPGVATGLSDEPVRLQSLMPTIVTYLGFGERLAGVQPLDGRPLEWPPTDTQVSSTDARSSR